MALTPATTAEEHTTFDTGVENLLLVPASLDTADFIDAQTEILNLLPSVVENAQFVDAATESVVLIASGVDTAQYVDASIETLLLIPLTVAEEHTTYDTSTESLLLVPSSLDSADFIDSNTESLTLKPSSTDKAYYIDVPGIIDYSDIVAFPPDTGVSFAQGGGPLLAQSFIPAVGGNIESLIVVLTKVGAPTDNALIEIRTNSGNAPSSTVLGSYLVDPATLDTSIKRRIPISFSTTVPVTGGQKYWIVFSRTGPTNNTNRYAVWTPFTNMYPNGNAATNIGSPGSPSWNIETYDFFFAVRMFGDPVDAQIALAPSSTDTADFVDSNTEFLGLVPSVSDIAQFVDQDTESLVLAPSANDIVLYVDDAIEELHLTLTTQEEHTTYDTNVEALALTASSTDQAEFVDSGSEIIVLAPSGSDIFQAQDAASEILALVPSDTQSFQGKDADTERLSLAPSVTDIAQFVDTDIEVLLLLPSGSDIYVPAGPGSGEEFGTETFSLLPSGSEQRISSDAGTEPFQLVPNTSEIADLSEANTGTIRTFSTSTDIAEFIDQAAKRLAFDILSMDTFSGFDGSTDELKILISGSDVSEFVEVDTNSVYLHEVPTSTDIAQLTEANQIYLKLTPSAYELYKIYEIFTSIALKWESLSFTKWFGKSLEKRFSGGLMRRWWSSVD